MVQKESVEVPGIGSLFPDLKVDTNLGEISLPDKFAGEWFVLFSHPADFTPVCTSELVAFARRSSEFSELGCNLIGLSMDDAETHDEWLEALEEKFDIDISFPVITDENGETAGELGLIHPGSEDMTVRGTMIVDPAGIIRMLNYYPLEVGRNTGEVLRTVEALQISDENEVAMPADWPQNDEVGEQVMVEPEEARAQEESKKQQLHGDWWFCYRQL